MWPGRTRVWSSSPTSADDAIGFRNLFREELRRQEAAPRPRANRFFRDPTGAAASPSTEHENAVVAEERQELLDARETHRLDVRGNRLVEEERRIPLKHDF